MPYAPLRFNVDIPPPFDHAPAISILIYLVAVVNLLIVIWLHTRSKDLIYKRILNLQRSTICVYGCFDSMAVVYGLVMDGSIVEGLSYYYDDVEGTLVLP